MTWGVPVYVCCEGDSLPGYKRLWYTATTLGLQHKRYTPIIKLTSFGLALVIAGGNMLIALSVKLDRFLPDLGLVG